ncbi:MAG: hypothetical protein IJ535_13380 [Pseudobutyrivibrio sp.]|uniref:CRISPR-associated protein Csn2-St n=1 Tax=Pseudobutyrivibrio sp. TaxID=2014367 RepID=UPI0025D01FD8|nr:CRISPR-associated protein Csn2-St [Pseudobutyrivibrio sp.]MBQ8490763.1 hypothetical protein [Pseudobutyrivibrio sp.]
MKLSIANYNENIEINFDVITQLCGQNLPIKNTIVDSICKHFSNDKYKDYEERLIDNILIDGEVPGRKQWECCRISNKDDILATIQMNKGSILGKCIKESINGFDCQNDLLEIDNILLRIFDRFNQVMFSQQPIELQYTQEDLFSMIQQTSVRTKDGEDIHVLPVEDVLKVFIEIVTMQQRMIPEKRLYVFENVDHYMNEACYVNFVKECEKIAKLSNIWFIFTTSLKGYIYISPDNIESINVINDVVYSMPAMEHIIDFANKYYPISRIWNQDDVIQILKIAIHDIGKREALLQSDELVFLKLMNDTLDLKTYWEKRPSTPEIQCLLDPNML